VATWRRSSPRGSAVVRQGEQATEFEGEAYGAGPRGQPAERAAGETYEAAREAYGQAEGRAHNPQAAAREICLRLLTAAPRTRAQLVTALRNRGVPESVAEEVLGRFAETGLIDDAAFARAWVESRHYSRGLSRRALAGELRERGVGDDEVRNAIDELG
jgi:regulatory protein